MSLSQQVRDALRALGGSSTSADLAEHMGVERAAISAHLTAMEKSGVVMIDRSEKPFMITLDEKRAQATEERAAGTAEAKPAATKRSAKARTKKPPKAKPTARRTRSPRATAPTETPNVIQLGRDLAMRLAVLALSSRDPMSDADRLSIAAVIKAAA